MKKGPIKVRVQVKDYVHEADLAADLYVPTNDIAGLNQALADNPALYAFWAQLGARAGAHIAELEAALDILKADLYTKTEGTVGERNAAVTLDARVQALEADLRKAQLNANACEAQTKAVGERGRSLIALAANMRSEMDNRLTVLSRDPRQQYPPPRTPGNAPRRT